MDAYFVFALDNRARKHDDIATFHFEAIRTCCLRRDILEAIVPPNIPRPPPDELTSRIVSWLFEWGPPADRHITNFRNFAISMNFEATLRLIQSKAPMSAEALNKTL